MPDVIDYSKKESLLRNGNAIRILSSQKYIEDESGFKKAIDYAWWNNAGNTVPLMPAKFDTCIDQIYAFYLTYSSYWHQAITTWKVPLFLYNNGLAESIAYYNEQLERHLYADLKRRHPAARFTEEALSEYAALCGRSEQLKTKISALSKKSERLAFSGRISESDIIERGELRLLQNAIYPVNVRIREIRDDALG